MRRVAGMLAAVLAPRRRPAGHLFFSPGYPHDPVALAERQGFCGCGKPLGDPVHGRTGRMLAARLAERPAP